MISNDVPEPARQPSVAVAILAAGHGTRMRSALPKHLHPVAGLPIIERVLRAGLALQPDVAILVVSPRLQGFLTEGGYHERATMVVQDPPEGSGAALRVALEAAGDADWIVSLLGDSALLTGATVCAFFEGARNSGADLVLLSSVLDNAAAYGRVVRDQRGRVIRVVERKADQDGLRQGPTEINSGIMALNARWARQALPALQPNPASGEYYLTDLIDLAVRRADPAQDPWPVAAVQAPPDVAIGINDRVELAEADQLARQQIRRRWLERGVTLIGSDTIFIDEQVEIGSDTTILPFSMLTGMTAVGDGCRIGPQAVLDNARLGNGVTCVNATVRDSRIADGADVGPYSHIRGGTDVGPGVHVGNFAELKNTTVGAGVKIGHVSYLGDAQVGARSNIGAGTITANFDGQRKHRTEIGEDAFTGCHTVLRAPVRLGDQARTGAGAVVTKDVPDGATVVGMPARITQRVPAVEREEGER